MSLQESSAKRLIEVDLPIKRISAHARREKSIRQGHISALHIWWARRPLASCRAVICAALWPDPADAECPDAFVKRVRQEMLRWASHDRQKLLSEESRKRFEKARQDPAIFSDTEELRGALLDFIADFANWDNSTVREYLDTSRVLTQAAHEALGGETGTRPLVVDPFAGGGSIPLEALRVGADAFASDLNPIAVLLNKVLLEYVPKYGQRLADEVRAWGDWIKREAEKELAEFYPKDADGATPIAYLWARTIQCEGPGCGAEVPLIRSLWLSKKKTNLYAIKLSPRRNKKRLDVAVEIVSRPKIGEVGNGTVARGSATCPCCGYTTPVSSVRRQLNDANGGAVNARLLCVATTSANASGRFFRAPDEHDLRAVADATTRLRSLTKGRRDSLSLVPDEVVNSLPHSVNRLAIYGMATWGDAFTPRQALTLTTFTELVRKCRPKLLEQHDEQLATAIQSVLALGVSRLTDICNSLCGWSAGMQQVVHLFGRQAIPMTWDFAETSPLSGASGDYATTISNMLRVLEREAELDLQGHAELASATQLPLPSDSALAFVTDPPYYDAINYADLSDFFYVWLRRSLLEVLPDLFHFAETPKAKEIIVEPTYAADGGVKDRAFYLSNMRQSMSEGRRVLNPSGIGVIVFAHKSTAGWEAQIQGMMEAGLVITASWPIDTEREDKVSGIGQARLGSSIHLVCRPRENTGGSIRADQIGDWRDVLVELPRRIHEWMPRLAKEGVVGADAIFACLGPALEIFSRYSRVEKASGEIVALREYLEHVWAAVAKAALEMIFAGADATGFEEDARLTAMWLWTLSSSGSNGDRTSGAEEVEGDEDEGDNAAIAKRKTSGGFALEYDAARKIAQGLGAHLDQLTSLVEVNGATARLLPVAERTRSLFHGGGSATPAGRSKAKKKNDQLSLGFVADIDEAEESGGWGTTGAPQKGETVLDRVHQSMILFGAGRGEALKRFLVEDGVGRDDRFWRLAQAFSALYPGSTDEKRWVDGVLARKKSLGF
jgi:putative DNA methylase